MAVAIKARKFLMIGFWVVVGLLCLWALWTFPYALSMEILANLFALILIMGMIMLSLGIIVGTRMLWSVMKTDRQPDEEEDDGVCRYSD